MAEYDVLFLWHEESQTWTAENDEIPFCIGSETLEKLMKRVKGVAIETLEINVPLSPKASSIAETVCQPSSANSPIVGCSTS